MIPKNLKPSKPSAPEGSWWEDGALDREIDQLFNWPFYCEAEDRTLDREIEMLRPAV